MRKKQHRHGHWWVLDGLVKEKGGERESNESQNSRLLVASTEREIERESFCVSLLHKSLIRPYKLASWKQECQIGNDDVDGQLLINWVIN